MSRKTATLACAVLLASVLPAASMTFRIAPVKIGNCTTNCPLAIIATGTVNLDDASTLVWTIAAHRRLGRAYPDIALVSSDGGNLVAGYQMGEAFRKLEMTVIVGKAIGSGPIHSVSPGFCGGSCVFALMGGVKRIVPPGSVVAVAHISDPKPQYTSGSVAFPDPAQEVSRARLEEDMARYIAGMGIKPEFSALIRALPNGASRRLGQRDLIAFGLVSPGPHQ